MSSFDPHELLEQLLTAAEDAVKVFNYFLDRDGGALYVICDRDAIHCSVVIRTPPNKKRGMYVDNARRKAVELTLQTSIRSTGPIANPEGDPPLYGGGIRLSNGWIIAFSGYPPEWDEAFCVALAKHFELLEPEHEAEIVRFYKNADRVADAEQYVQQVA